MLVQDARIFAFDTETTGANPETANIVELGVLLIERGQVCASRRWLINPGMPIPAEATAIHHITDIDVAGAPSMADIRDEVLGLLRMADAVCGYNIVHYDIPILLRELNIHPAFLADAPPSVKRPIDPLIFARHLFRHVRGRKLSDICEGLGIGLDPAKAHTAIADTEAAWEVAKRLVTDGLIPSDLDTLVEIQDGLVSLQAHEDQEYKWWFYHDRRHPKIARGLPEGINGHNREEYLSDVPLMVGAGKHIGVPLDRIDRGFLSWLLSKNDLPPKAVEVVKARLGGQGRTR